MFFCNLIIFVITKLDFEKPAKEVVVVKELFEDEQITAPATSVRASTFNLRIIWLQKSR